jgi:hypothetical protein
MPYIAYSMPKTNGAIYATVVESRRNGGKVEQRRIENLGRVVDRGAGIYEKRTTGMYRYELGKGATELSSEDKLAYVAKSQEKLILDFGDTYVLWEYVKKQTFMEAIAEMLPGKEDTLFSMLFYRVLTDKKASYYAQAWWNGNYASQLFPAAQLAGQRISEFLVRLGDEGVQRGFFRRYLEKLWR